MKIWIQVALLAMGLWAAAAAAEPDTFGLGTGRDGLLTVTSAGTVINRYAQVAAPIAPGDNVLLVAGTEGFASGDLVMVLQVSGLVPEPTPGSPGPIDLTHDEVGRWELARLAAVEERTLTLTAPLVYSYAARVTQVIRIPEYTQVRIPRGAGLRAMPWNGDTGGVMAFLATSTVHNDGEISATAAGFRGGRYMPDHSDPMACAGLALAARPAAQKGEGVAITQYGPTKTGRESGSNGGGGGVCPMAGGGGGGNGGPGGRGGSFVDMGQGVQDIGGQGGAKLVYSMFDHLSFGGGGGSGSGGGWLGSEGGTGGGAVFIRANRLSGTGSIVADGELGGSTSREGASGGGAGGSIYLQFDDFVECGNVSARGGAGGNVGADFANSGSGGGGGGGGGQVLLLAGLVNACPLSVKAGLAGTSVGMHVVSTHFYSSHPTMDELSLYSGLIIYSSSGVVAPSFTGALVSKPVVTMPKPDAHVNPYPELIIKGTATAKGLVTVYIDSIEVGKKTADDAGEWTLKILTEDGVPDPISFKDGSDYQVVASEQGVDSAPVSFTVDTQKPGKPLVISPANGSSINTSSLTITGKAEAKSKVTVNVTPLGGQSPVKTDDNGNWSVLVSGLLSGEHVITAVAEDEALNSSESSASVTFTVDTQEPAVPVVASPMNGSPVNPRKTSLTGQAEGKSTISVKINNINAGTSKADSSGNWTFSISHLPEGKYVVAVTARDMAGNTSAPATVEFTVDLLPPDTIIESGPQGPTRINQAQFSFSSSEPGSSFECNRDGLGFVACRSPVTFGGLQDGQHTLEVRAVDLAGNEDTQPDFRLWTVDTELPNVTVLSPTEANSAPSTPTIEGTASESCVVRIFIDGQSVGVTTTEKGQNNTWIWRLTLSSPLLNGTHMLNAVATDLAQNTNGLPSPITFSVDAEPPIITIEKGPPNPHKEKRAFFTFKSESSDVVKFECRLSSESDFTFCGDAVRVGTNNEFTLVYEVSGDGEYRLQVRARDKAGNAGPPSEEYIWTVIIQRPQFPDVSEPMEGAMVDTATPRISGLAVPNGSVTLFIDGDRSGIAPVDDSGRWTFRPSVPLSEGKHRLSGLTTDIAGNTSEQHSPERFFTVHPSAAETRAIGGGLSCAASGPQPSLVLLGLAGLTQLAVRRRRPRNADNRH